MTIKIILFVAIAFMVKRGWTDTTEDEDLLTDTFKKANNGSFAEFDSDLIKSCFERQTTNFDHFAKQLTKMTTAASSEISKLVESKRHLKPMKRIAKSYKELPQTLWPHALNLQFGEALKAANDVGVVTSEAEEEVKNDIKKNNPDFTEKVDMVFKDIHEEGVKRSRNINQRILSCIRKESTKKRT